MIRARDLIGSAVELVAGRPQVQRCYGTYRGDIPDARFRINIQHVEHQGDFPMHSHEYTELVIVLAGSAGHRTDAVEHQVAGGDVFVIHGDQSHAFVSARDLKLCNIQFDPRQFLADQCDLHRMAGFHALFDLEPRSRGDRKFEQRLRLNAAQAACVKGELDELKREFDDHAEGRQTMIRGRFLQLVTALSRFYAAVSAAPTPVTRMAGVISHIRQHFRQPLAIDELARLSHLSPSQFQRVFRKTYHTSPIQFINQLRIDESCELLRHTHRDVAAIAGDCGFASASFFCTRFRHRIGLSPTQYRKQHQDSVSQLIAQR